MRKLTVICTDRRQHPERLFGVFQEYPTGWDVDFDDVAYLKRGGTRRIHINSITVHETKHGKQFTATCKTCRRAPRLTQEQLDMLASLGPQVDVSALPF